ncbi:UvrD-helicase domain-containing protein [Pseudodesulfovibrio piezophilus]|uniref:DNA 3'-5' helicase n=1 Tax=Pseudodesulfovibrio piezophilus (strain DSM 21447 / JCM 15486 / C1TLV30) TaxID=1322246 RepID=M1WNE4_PSEP2|nr:UvrD-helicase domain-containing protein [Pseudodesulfovibrio piezophilus]CCH47524.1 UvrD/REP helicase [Pseudodesulfovibrio piezophilus C1TLV30]
MSELKQVKASAGSGKTYQLTSRFLSLLENAESDSKPFACTSSPRHGYAWPEIMAVTFTNKAATEMKERVVVGLKEAALGLNTNLSECSSETASKAIDTILRRYHRLNIRTIDSLLALLLRLFALEFGIRPDFQIVFEERELFDTVYDHFINMCIESGSEQDLLSSTVSTMIQNEGKGGFWMQDTVRKRLFEMAQFLRTEETPLLCDQETIKGLLTATFADYKQTIQCTLEYFTDTGLPFDKRFVTYLKKSLATELFETPKDSTFIHKPSLQDCVNKAGKEKVDARAEAEYAALKRACSHYAIEHATLTGAYFLAPAINIALRLLNGLDELQKQRGLILGSSLAGFVNALLAYGDPVSEAYCRLGCRLHHLLVDEFQDTSRAQWQAITPLAQECLAKGGSLFYVGDVKQAIYGWRGGDSALFDEVMMQPEVASLALTKEHDSLPANWRSFKNIVEFNNTFFDNFTNPFQSSELTETLFKGAPEDFRKSFAEELTQSFSACSQAICDKNLTSEGYVRMELLSGGTNDETETAVLDSLSQLLDELTQRRRFRDLAILVRTHTHASLICDLLVQKNIPVITENSLQLDRHPIIRQLAAFLAFLDFPRDDLAFLTFASGREVFQAEAMMEETDFLDWLSHPRKRPLGVCFREDFPNEWKYFIEPFYNQSGLMTPYDLVREAIRTFRVFERHPEAELYVRRFLEVIHLAEENGYGSLSGFLEYWEEKSSEEKVPLPENIDAVRIMTIYKSKGLEFPVVIIPFHNWAAKPDKDFVIRSHKKHRLLVPMRKGLGKPYLTSLGRSAKEQLNLLYVAWTRAREELYGFFTESSAKCPASVAMNLFLNMNDEPILEYGSIPTQGKISKVEPAKPPVILEEQDQYPQLMEWLPRLRIYRHNLDEYFYNEKMRGEVAHRTMEHLQVTDNDLIDMNRAISLAFQDFPALGALGKKEFDRLEDDLRTMVGWVLGNPTLRQWLSGGEKEPEIMDAEGNFKRFDLLCRTPETIVVDFKTGRPSPKNQEQVLDYMQILNQMSGLTPAKGYLVYLDLQEIREVRETN